MKVKLWQSYVLAVTGLSLFVSMSACTSGPGNTTNSNAHQGSSPTTSSVPEPMPITPSEPARPTPESREGDDFGVAVDGIRYIVEDSFYADSVEFNVGSETYPEWQTINAEEGSRFLVVDGIIVNESKESIYPYAPITVRVHAEASDGAQYEMDPSSHAIDTRVVPKLHTLPPHYETAVRYLYMTPTFLDIEQMVMSPVARYESNQEKRVAINP